MSSLKLTARATVMGVQDGEVEIDSDRDGEYMIFPVGPHEASRWKHLLREEGAVVVTVEPAAAPAAAPLRSAEEIAREIVPLEDLIDDPNGQVIVPMRHTSGTVWVSVSRPSVVRDVRTFLARLIERSRAEGAAAERERARAETHAEQFYATPEDAASAWSTNTGSPPPSRPRFCACGKPRPLIHGTLCKCLDCGGFCDLAEPDSASQPRDLAGRTSSCDTPCEHEVELDVQMDRISRKDRLCDLALENVTDALACVAQGQHDEAARLLTEARGHLLGIDRNRDLAGRIRALVIKYTEQSIDASVSALRAGDESWAYDASDVTVSALRAAYLDAVTGADVMVRVTWMRNGATCSGETKTSLSDAANELEAIVRECER